MNKMDDEQYQLKESYMRKKKNGEETTFEEMEAFHNSFRSDEIADAAIDLLNEQRGKYE